jgi:hypothetical protein
MLAHAVNAQDCGAREAFQEPKMAKALGTKIKAQMILSKWVLTHGILPKK